MVVAVPAMPVAVKLTGLPFNPVAVALSVFAPAVPPSVQLPTVAIPALDVVAVAPVMLPLPDATANVTLAPATAFPFASVIFTDGATDTALPAVAD